jgi:hypothetical protein
MATKTLVEWDLGHTLHRHWHALCRDWKRTLKAQHKSDATIRIHLTAVHHLVAYLIAEGELCTPSTTTRTPRQRGRRGAVPGREPSRTALHDHSSRHPGWPRRGRVGPHGRTRRLLVYLPLGTGAVEPRRGWQPPPHLDRAHCRGSRPCAHSRVSRNHGRHAGASLASDRAVSTH